MAVRGLKFFLFFFKFCLVLICFICKCCFDCVVWFFKLDYKVRLPSTCHTLLGRRREGERVRGELTPRRGKRAENVTKMTDCV